MATVSTYLNFNRNTEEAFNFYKSVFGGDFAGKISRFGEVPPMEGAPPMSDADKQLVMHISLKIADSHYIMGTDAPETMGFKLKQGNNVYICINPDNRAETKRLFDGLSAGGKVETELQEMFWGDYYASFTDKYGVQWMLNCTEKK